MSKNLLTYIVIAVLTVIVPGRVFSQEHNALSSKIERDIELQTFVPKGQWIVGSSVSFSVNDNKRYNFLFIEGVSGHGHSVKASPIVCYSFADNQAAGLRGSYKRSFMRVDSLGFALDDELDGSVQDIYFLKHSCSASAVYRYYINIGNSRRFGILTEMQLEYGGGKSKMINGQGYDVSGTFQETQEFAISFVPGLVAFINDYTAAEVTVGVLGFNHTKTKQITNQIYEGKMSSSGGNFRINILSISLGLAFYL